MKDLKEGDSSFNLWLVLIMAGLFLHALLMVYQVQEIYIQDFISGRNEAIIKSNKRLVIFYFIGLGLNLGLIVYELILVYLLKKVSPKARKLLVIFCIICSFLIVMDIIISIIFIDYSINKKFLLFGKGLRLLLVQLVLFYFSRSRRMKSLFP